MSVLTNSTFLYFFKKSELKTHNVQLKRNMFIYAKYFQWFTKCLSYLVLIWSREKQVLINSRTHLYNNKLLFFFITKKQYSFLTVLAQSLLTTSRLLCFNIKWDSLLFFFLYRYFRERLSGFFPIFFIDSQLLLDATFKQNFISNFLKHPVFFVWNLNSKLPVTPHLLKKTYPLFIPTGYGLYLFLFWIRFIFKLG